MNTSDGLATGALIDQHIRNNRSQLSHHWRRSSIWGGTPKRILWGKTGIRHPCKFSFQYRQRSKHMQYMCVLWFGYVLSKSPCPKTLVISPWEELRPLQRAEPHGRKWNNWEQANEGNSRTQGPPLVSWLTWGRWFCFLVYCHQDLLLGYRSKSNGTMSWNLPNRETKQDFSPFVTGSEHGLMRCMWIQKQSPNLSPQPENDNTPKQWAHHECSSWCSYTPFSYWKQQDSGHGCF